MTSYAKKEQALCWPVSKKLMAEYKDGSHNYEDSNGNLWWYQNDQLHRDQDKPAFIGWDGRLEWYQNGLYHRDGDKPAYIDANGTLFWYQNSQLHRFRDPAVIYASGRFEWWINGEDITDEVTDWLSGKEWQGTPEQIVEFKLRFF